MRRTIMIGSCLLYFSVPTAIGQTRPDINQATLLETKPVTAQVTTEELKEIFLTKSAAVLDVRSALEFAIAHIPGSLNVYEREVDTIMQLFPGRSTALVLYCNGPYCGKSRRVSEQLFDSGYKSIRRYQLGLPVWRALGNTVQTDMKGFHYVFTGDKTAVFVDARHRLEFEKSTVPGAVNIREGEAEEANEDGRLPLHDKGTRVIVFANSAQDARKVAEEIAKKAYWNSSYFGGTLEELQSTGLWK